MPTQFETLEAQVLNLPMTARSHLLERLILSLDGDAEVDAAWDIEADRREAELASGAVIAVDGPIAMKRLRARIR